jgi:hypothetical protein
VDVDYVSKYTSRCSTRVSTLADFVLWIENFCRRVGSLFVQDAEANCQTLIEDSSDMLFPDSLCSQLVQREISDKDR